MNREECYVERLRKHLSGTSPVTIDNRAVGGWNVYKSMPKGYIPPPRRDAPVDWYTITDAVSANPDIIIVNYPSNGYDVFTVAEVMYCFRTIKKVAEVAGKKCFITTTQPRDNFSDQNRKKLREIKDSVMLQFGASAIDFWTGLADTLTNTIAKPYQIPGDPIHMNGAAHAVMFERVLSKISLSSPAPAPAPPPVAPAPAPTPAPSPAPARTFNSFTATLQNKKVILKWTTPAALPVYAFRVEHASRSTFTTIGNVVVNQDNKYSFIHDAPALGKNVYRITAISPDGKEKDSDTIHITRSPNGLVSIRWLRSAKVLRLEADMRQQVTIRILNGMGQLLLMVPFEMEQGINNVSLNMQPSPGVYIIRVNGKDWHTTERFSSLDDKF